MSNQEKPGFDAGAIRAHVIRTWAQTLLGIGSLSLLIVAALFLLGFHWSVPVIFLLVMAAIPVISWYFSAPLIKKLTRCQEPDPNDPDHARLIRIVDKLFPKTGLPVKPPVYVSPMPVANAFATGRSPSTAFIAATEGLFFLDLTDEELEAVVAHELAHVANYDTAITSLTATMSSFFSILLAGGLPWLFKSAFVSKSNAPLLNKLTKKVGQKKRFLEPTGGFFGFILTLAIFYLVNFFAKLIALFVSRARESSADAYSAKWTGNPCALSTALQKLVLFENLNGGNVGLGIILRGLTPVLMVNHFSEEGFGEEPDQDTSLVKRLRRWWRRLGENHPPVMERIRALEKMGANKCPRLF